MRDCIGNELHIGDKIVCTDDYYDGLMLGSIIRFAGHEVVCEVVRATHQNGDPIEVRRDPVKVHLVHYRKLAVKRTFMNDSADKPYKDYYCSNCGNRDTVNEEDNFCSICGSKFTTEDELCELAARLVIQDIAAEKKENELKEFLETIKSGKLPPLNLNSKRGIDYINKN